MKIINRYTVPGLYYSSQTKDAYINEKNIKNGNEGLVEVAGTEMQRSIDYQKNTLTNNESKEFRDSRAKFSQNVGNNIKNYTNFALDFTNQGTMSTTTNINTQNQVTTTPSVFNQSNTVARNNNEFKELDKEQGDNRALASEEKILLFTQGAKDLKDVIASESKHLSKENINYIYEQTQKALVDTQEEKVLNQLLQKAEKQGIKDEVEFVIDESKQQILSDAKNNVYLDKQGDSPQLIKMMNENNKNNPRYYPSSDVKHNKEVFNSSARTTAGLIPNPLISAGVWAVDTVININNEKHNNVYEAGKNTYLPALMGNPLSKPIVQKAGAVLSYKNLVDSIETYNTKTKIKEFQRDINNKKEIVDLTNNMPKDLKKEKNIFNQDNKVLIKPTWLKGDNNVSK